MRDTDKDWTKIAEEQPYWGVLSVDEYKGTELADDVRQQFFRSGRDLVQNTFAFVKRHVNPQFKPQRSLDFGCGVGRLLIPIAQFSGEAVGVDVAPRMLDLAKSNFERAGIANASVVLGDDALSAVTGKFDFVNTYIVMQHIPPSRGYVILQKLLQLLNPGGVASIQLTYAKARRFMSHEIGRARFYRRDGQVIYDLISDHSEPPPGSVTMFDYDLNQVMAIISTVAGSPIMTLATNDDGHLGVQFIFSTKAAPRQPA